MGFADSGGCTCGTLESARVDSGSLQMHARGPVTDKAAHFFLEKFGFGLKCCIFDFVEGRQHLGNPKKNEFSFGISLDLHYLCSIWEKRRRYHPITATERLGL